MRSGRCFVGASILGLLILVSFLTQPVVPQKRDFHVCYMNTIQKEVLQGKTVIVTFGVFYSIPYYYASCGEPCELKPRAGQAKPTGSFEIKGSIRVTDTPVTPTGKLGEYRAELSLPTEASVGKAIVFIVKDSLYDGQTTGPERNSSHVETSDPTDDSTFMLVGSAHSVVLFLGFSPERFATFAGLFTLLIFLATFLLFSLRHIRKSRDIGSSGSNRV